MNGDEEIEVLRRAFTAPGGTAPQPADCPAPETIWAAVHGELPPGPLRDVIDHTATCPACAEEWRLAVEMEREEESAGSAVAPPRRPRRWARLAPYLAAAAAVLLLVIGLPRMKHPGEPILRGPKPVVSQLDEGQELPRSHCLLRWSGPAGATYAVEVHTQVGEPVAREQDLAATQYLVPESALAAISTGTRLEWQVTATLPGEAPRRSKPSTFLLR